MNHLNKKLRNARLEILPKIKRKLKKLKKKKIFRIEKFVNRNKVEKKIFKIERVPNPFSFLENYRNLDINPKENHKFFSIFLSSISIKSRKELNELLYQTCPSLKMDLDYTELWEKLKENLPRQELVLKNMDNEKCAIYQESCHLMILSLILTNKIEKLANETHFLLSKLKEIQVKFLDYNYRNTANNLNPNMSNEKNENAKKWEIVIDCKKRYRRSSQDLEKLYSCHQDKCNKSYW